ncbi:MAG TPA: FAD-dependent oxidoreductase [Gemmatimonadaceae bacterium]|nr:FAD-dependent oxidoreductase [Gemmatimonadaceae bacterium]
MGGEAELSGPDFGAGIDATTLHSGDRLLGHANGEPVLLVRLEGDGDIIAIAASCTHYGGPLAEGAIVGDTIRCPWHHACFSLRTGEALRAPALNPVSRWNVEERGGKIIVTDKIQRDPLAPDFPIALDRSVMPRDVVILGGGAAGSAAAEMLRRCHYDGRITMVDDDDGSPYDRPNLSKDYLAGNAPEEWIPLRPAGFYEEHDVRVVRGTATHLDTSARTVTVTGHGIISYDALLLATGAEPVHLKIAGDDQPHVHYLRSLNDSRSIIAATKTAKRAVGIGASFIGLEVAASLRARNVDVHVVAPEKLPLERILGEYLGAFIQSVHEAKGVVFHLGRTPERIESDAVVLNDGTRLPCDLVVVGVGVKPRLGLAEEAGLVMDRGVEVDTHLETSVPGVFAAGDIARWPDPHSGDRIRVEHWVVALRQGQVAARNILGANERFDLVPFFWSAHYDVTINYVGHAEKWDRVDVDGSADQRDAAVRLVRAGKVLALATIARDAESLNTEIAMERALTERAQDKILS